MRFRLLACALSALMASGVYAQSLSDIVPSQQRAHDFGAVPRSSKAEHTFVLSNPFKSDLILGQVRASCGCTTPILQSQVIKPGQSATLIAHFNTDKFNGEKKATLTIPVQGPVLGEIQLNVKGYIRTDVVLNPGEAALGNVPEATGKEMVITLDYAGRADWAIQSIVSPYPFVKVDFAEANRGGGRVRYTLRIALDQTAPEGYLDSHLVVHTNDNRLKNFPITLTGSVEKAMKTSPPSLALGKVRALESVAQRLTLMSKSEFKVLEITSDVAEIRFDPPKAAKKVHLMNIEIIPKGSRELSEVKSHLIIKTDRPDEKSTIEIPLSFSIETEKLANTTK